jgi:hypothetical protein
VLTPDRIPFVRGDFVGWGADRLLNYNPWELLNYRWDGDPNHAQEAASVIRERIYDSLVEGILNAGVGVDENFNGIIVLDFEEFRPAPTFEKLSGKLAGHGTLQYYYKNKEGNYRYDPLSVQEYTESMTTFWTGAFARYREEFPHARFALYQAPRAFTYPGWNADPTPDADVTQTNFDAEAAWLYPLLDVIAIHDYMSVKIEGNIEYDDVRDFHRDLAIRGIRLARQYRKPCFVYFKQYIGAHLITLEEMRAWYDGYLAALAETDGGWPMMGVSFWIGAIDEDPNVFLANAFLENVFVPAYIERFTIGTMNGLKGVMIAGY